MKKNLITDFLDFDQINSHHNQYLELPVFDKNYILKKNITFHKRWNDNNKKLIDIKKNLKLYNYFLKELIIFLNNYHNKNYSTRYWEIILGAWLYRFISSVSFKWNLIKPLKKNKYIFLKKKINSRDVIPAGIEDAARFFFSNFWNHYIYTKIIEHSFSNKIKIKEKGKLTKNLEKKIIYQKLLRNSIKERISTYIQNFFNFFAKDNCTLIFSTYMSNFHELKLNLLVNKSLLYYRLIRPYFLFRNSLILNFKRRNFNKHKLKYNGGGLKNFLSKEILNNLPSTYLENFSSVENIVDKIPFPKKPKKIFTCIGITRSTLMDRYIAKNVENGSSLILAQHGGNYFQHKLHFASIHEVKISDKYLSWGRIKKKKLEPIGIIKNLRSSNIKSNKIILEIRMRSGYNQEIKLDSGFLESKNYLANMCKFFSLIKGKKVCENLFVKLHEFQSFWNKKKQFLKHNSELNFLDRNKKMINEMNSASLIIHTFFSTGHLECLALNKPTLILFVNDLNLLNNKSKYYIKEMIKLNIVHRTPESLLKTLESLDGSEKIKKWWNFKKRQSLLKKYREDFSFFNQQKIKDLKRIIKDV